MRLQYKLGSLVAFTQTKYWPQIRTLALPNGSFRGWYYVAQQIANGKSGFRTDNMVIDMHATVGLHLGEAVGICVHVPVDEGNLFTFYTKPSRRGQGIARKLFNKSRKVLNVKDNFVFARDRYNNGFFETLNKKKLEIPFHYGMI